MTELFPFTERTPVASADDDVELVPVPLAVAEDTGRIAVTTGTTLARAEATGETGRASSDLARQQSSAVIYGRYVEKASKGREIERDPRWRDNAACRDARTDDFYAFDGTAGQRRALATCERCPVKSECCEYALALRDWEGIWGGTTGEERRSMKRRAYRAARN